jgi:ribonuclease-3
VSDLARKDLQAALGYTFQSENLFLQALTHRSYANERGSTVGHNERLEFLGDAVLGISASHLLVERFPRESEGTLSRMRASLVSAQSLAGVARSIGLGAALRLGRGEELTGGRDKPSLLADALEAILGAIYLDSGGLAAALGVVRSLLGAALDLLEQCPDHTFDPKTRLQELVQAERKTTPAYSVVATHGPEHEKTFESAISIDGEVLATGVGRNKKDAEQQAALAALRVLQDRARAAGAHSETPPDDEEPRS